MSLKSAASFANLQIGIASPEEIRSWSYGEVLNDETLNPLTMQPKMNGLFCERIFGPTAKYACFCRKWAGRKKIGQICAACGVEVGDPRVRRERVGHIELASPVAHPWFYRALPCRIADLIGVSRKELEAALFCSQRVVTSVDEDRIAVDLNNWGSVDADFDDDDDDEDDFAEAVKTLTELKAGDVMDENAFSVMSEISPEGFSTGFGGAAVRKILSRISPVDLLKELKEEWEEADTASAKNALKRRLSVAQELAQSENMPEWMILTVVPVLPPDLRPLIKDSKGGIVSSDLNDLYRNLIRRNNRLKQLIGMGSPEIMLNNERRLLQIAVDNLFDNDSSSSPSKRKSHRRSSDNATSITTGLKGKKGRFRQNLLGKRVDYSGRSVIISGPNLSLGECGLPRKIALELYRPKIIGELCRTKKDGPTLTNQRVAERMIDERHPDALAALEKVAEASCVILNRAPTLHRLGMQAFRPQLNDHLAIELHPLSCSGFNADFDGDQMAVHLPLSDSAVQESREKLTISNNMLLPSSGVPSMMPTLDMVLGIYYMTTLKENPDRRAAPSFASEREAETACEAKAIDLREPIRVRVNGEMVTTSVGRIIFNAALPDDMPFVNEEVEKKVLSGIVDGVYAGCDKETMIKTLDRLKDVGFKYSTRSGISIAVSDMAVPEEKREIVAEAESQIDEVENYYEMGLMDESEIYDGRIKVWTNALDSLTAVIQERFREYGGVFLMANSGAKGNITQVKQMVGMRGLMSGPGGKTVDSPIRSSFREGLSVLEYFISTHGARKGLTDTALNTASSGYLTRKMVDVSVNVIISGTDCGTNDGFEMDLDSLLSRTLARDITHPRTGETVLRKGEAVDKAGMDALKKAGVETGWGRTALRCGLKNGVCAACYGLSLATLDPSGVGDMVGVLAAQSIGEPGTQLTMRTFHSGGVAGSDITSGLPRVEEIFEAREPKGRAKVVKENCEIIDVAREKNGGWTVTVLEETPDSTSFPHISRRHLYVDDGQKVAFGEQIASPDDDWDGIAHASGSVKIEGEALKLVHWKEEEKKYKLPPSAPPTAKAGDRLEKGDPLTSGSLDLNEMLELKGREAVERYVIDEILNVYHSQGVDLHPKHVEIILTKMLGWSRVDVPGDTGEVIGTFARTDKLLQKSATAIANGLDPAAWTDRVLGIKTASLNVDSFISAAGFQNVKQILSAAAASGAVDELLGVKENVMLGRALPDGQKKTGAKMELPDPLAWMEEDVDLDGLDLDPVALQLS